MTYNRKILHRNGSGTIVMSRKMMQEAGWDIADSVDVTVGAGGMVTMKPVRGSILMTIAGVDCYTWQDVAYVAGREWEKERAAGSSSENGGDVAADGGQGVESDHENENSALF